MKKPFKVIILGSGTGVPLKDRKAPGIVVEGGETSLLFDSGSGAAYQIAEAGLRYYELDHLFYSHYAHPDHVNDLAELIFSNEYFDPRRTQLLYIYGPQGMKNFVERLITLYPILGKVSYPMKVQEIAESTVEIADMVVISRPVTHQQNACLAYRIEYQGRSIIYSGDTDYCESLITLSLNGDLLVVECSFPDGYKVEGHLTPAEIGEIASQAGVKKVILTHLYPLCDQFDVVAQVKEKFGGEVILGADLMTVII